MEIGIKECSMKQNKIKSFINMEIIMKIVIICVLDVLVYKLYELIDYREFSSYIADSMRGLLVLQAILMNDFIIVTKFEDLKDKTKSSLNGLKVLILGILINIVLILIGMCFIDTDYAGFRYWGFTVIVVLVARKIGREKLQCNKQL